MAELNWREIWVGTITLVIVLAIASVLTIAPSTPNSSADDGLFLSAEFNRVDGLAVGSPVRLAGIDIGEVKDMSLVDNKRALVTIAIADASAQIPSDSSAIIETDGIFGEKYLELQPGGDFEVLTNGSRISYVQDSVVLESLLNQIVARAKAARDAAGTSAQ